MHKRVLHIQHFGLLLLGHGFESISQWDRELMLFYGNAVGYFDSFKLNDGCCHAEACAMVRDVAACCQSLCPGTPRNVITLS